MYYIFCNLLLLWFGIDLCERDNIKSNLQSKSTKNRYLSSRLSELLSSCATPWQERQLQYDTPPLDSPVRGSTVFTRPVCQRVHPPFLWICISPLHLAFLWASSHPSLSSIPSFPAFALTFKNGCKSAIVGAWQPATQLPRWKTVVAR